MFPRDTYYDITWRRRETDAAVGCGVVLSVLQGGDDIVSVVRLSKVGRVV